MKKVFLPISFIFCLSLCFAEDESVSFSANKNVTILNKEEPSSEKIMPKMDIELRFYLPSLVDNTTGTNPYMKLRNYEESLKVNKSVSFMMEGRGEITTINKFSFVYGFGCSSYVETETSDNHKYTSLDVSLGVGIYCRPFFETYSLTGTYLFFYPIFNLPVYVLDDITNTTAYGANDYYWKIAADLGYTFSVFDYFTCSPYMRSIIGWLDEDLDVALDFGFTIGYYFHDKHYFH